MDHLDKIENLKVRLQSLDHERAKLVKELQELERANREFHLENVPPLGRPTAEKTPGTNEQKTTLFLDLFRCRRSVFPKRWENRKTGKSGYSPMCLNEWVKPICQKPRIKCTDCEHQSFPELDELAASNHLRGDIVVGTYAIDTDDACKFLVCDFDKGSWKQDILAYKQSASSLGIEVAIERSRSGNGGHAWIFFEEKTPARVARSLGTLILARCSGMDLRSTLASYDRFFPSQDYLPKGGFGNLIALPLQKNARETGNSVFIDEHFNAYDDQWKYLSQVRRLSELECKEVLKKQVLIEYFQGTSENFDDHSYKIDVGILNRLSESDIDDRLDGETIEIIFGPMLEIETSSLPSRLVQKLKSLASFPNPEFYKLQRMRMQTYPHRRFIFSGEFREESILLPRGLLDSAINVLQAVGAKILIRDERVVRRRLKAKFLGALHPNQSRALKQIAKHDTGVLVAPPGAGKTVIGCALIAKRKVSTLILVHRKPLMDQWRERLKEFLDLSQCEIGEWKGSKKKPSGKIDLAMLQTLTRMEGLLEIGDRYSQVIIDECHHIPATSFEAIMKQLPARYVIGLTATPYRKDSLEKILFHQCGPVRYEIESVDGGTLEKQVDVYETGFQAPSELGEKPPYHTLIHALVSDANRNEIIATKTKELAEEDRFVLVISDRKNHLDVLQDLLVEKVENSDGQNVHIIRLDGDLTPKQRRVTLEGCIEERDAGGRTMIFATASLIGEGFDLPELDALVLAMPLSFEGRIVQYAGRLHRAVEGKTNVRVVDFVDSHSPVFIKMCRQRLKAYKRMGYETKVHSNSTSLFANFDKRPRNRGFFGNQSLGR